jgi:hypothetical protein
MPRISVASGDFHPRRFVGAVVSGNGFDSPRKLGLMMIGVAVVFSVINFVLIMVLSRYYPYLYSLGSILGWGGLWLAITGQPKATTDGTTVPMWSRVGLGVALVFGTLSGLSLVLSSLR